jgi:LysR family hydrogen peroxide-inducible transcriptional activator
MELRHLQALVGVAENGSFSAAADAIGTVQSNISAHVARLEAELKVKLVDRGSGHLTPEGEVVVARAYRVFAELDSLGADLGALRAEVSGTVRIGMIGTTARWLVPRLLAAALALHPKLRVVVSEGTTTGLEPLLGAGRLDAAIVTLPVAGRELNFEPLFDEEIVLVVPERNDPTLGMSRVGLPFLAGLDLILPAPGTPFRAEIDSAVKPSGVRLHPLAELDGVRLIASLAFEGYGPALLPATAVPGHLRPRFRLVAVDGLPRRQVGLVVRSRGLPSAATRAALTTLRDVLSDSTKLPEGIHPPTVPSSDRMDGSVRAIGAPNG